MAGRYRPPVPPLLFGAMVLGPLLPGAAPPEDTISAFAAHIRATEARFNAVLQQRDSFLWADTPERRAALRTAGVICEPRVGKGDMTVPHGLIHHWVGSTFIPGVTVARVLALVQDYDSHKNTYPRNVIDSKTLQRRGNDFRVHLRLLGRKLSVTAVLDTEYEVRYVPLPGGDYGSFSHSTRVVEIANAGTPHERRKSGREDRGYLWRLNSYWLFRQRDGGTFVECEVVSLSRDIPGPVVTDAIGRSIIRGMPREFLGNTLEATYIALAKK